MIKRFSVGTQVKYVGSDEEYQGVVGVVKGYIDFGFHVIQSNLNNRVLYIHDSDLEGLN